MPHVAFVSHGGGPMPVLGDISHAQLVSTLSQLSQCLPKHPAAIVVISAHWETSGFEITAAAHPSLLYDYYGFPDAAYQLQYPAPGAPELAREVAHRMANSGLPVTLNSERGFDHGMFIPLMLMYPDATIPVLQISLDSTLNPDQHWQLGEALASVLADDVLVLGSGFSFHNMRAFFAPKTSKMDHNGQAFQHWLDDTVTSTAVSVEAARRRWSEWDKAEGGRFCHPREEHLLPLTVCHAVAQAQGQAFPFMALGVEARHYCW